jgi:hypothetical protein
VYDVIDYCAENYVVEFSLWYLNTSNSKFSNIHSTKHVK